MADPSQDDKERSAFAFAIAVAVVAFLAGTCLIPATISLVVSLFSQSLYAQLAGRSPANPDWQPGWANSCVSCGGVIAALLVAIVLARQTYRARLLKAERTSPECDSRPRSKQFTLKALLLLQLDVALGIGMVVWLGPPIVPAVLGIAGSMVGYGMTLFSGRRRAFDAFIGCVLGIVAGLIAAVPSSSLSPMERDVVAEDVRRWTVVAALVTMPLVAIIARWRLRRRDEDTG